MAVSTVARIRTLFTGVAGSPAYSNLFFDASTVDAGTYQTAVLEAWDSNSSVFQSALTITMVNPIPIINVATGQVVDVAVGDGGDTQGTDSNDALPPTNCALVRMHTGIFVAGREIRGRCFVPYFTEANSTGGKPTSAFVAGWNTVFNNLQGTSGANGAMVVYSRAHARAEYITSFDTWTQWGSVRSRRD
jgi:hypothetical protein